MNSDEQPTLNENSTLLPLQSSSNSDAYQTTRSHSTDSWHTSQRGNGLNGYGTAEAKGFRCSPVQLSWHNLTVVHPKSGRVILNDLSGLASPGKMIALMGASGAGKTTLLNTLQNRNLTGLHVAGEVLVNGNFLGASISNISGYVQQDELFVPTLTVGENLRIQAKLRLVGMPSAERQRRVEEVMKELGLSKCRNSRIGDAGITKGISGGEKKRLALAEVLLNNPPLLFFDEPTTGLDSAMAESVVRVLTRLAARGHTIICTIHQPSSVVFRLFDEVMFVAAGRLAFVGSPHASVETFARFGYICPTHYNPADMIIEVLAMEPTKPSESRQRIASICERFADSDEGRSYNEAVDRWRHAPEESVNARRREMAPFFTQTSALFQRASLDNLRNRGLARAKFTQKLFMGLFVGLLYFGSVVDRVGVANINGALFYLISELTYSTAFGILSFLPADFPLIRREYHDSMYYLAAYYIARVFSYVPLFTLDGIVMVSIAYWMAGLVPTIGHYATAVGICILTEQSAAAFGFMLSSVAPNYAVAMTLAGPLLSILNMTGGLYANISELPGFMRWFSSLSWFRYGFEALAINQWQGVANGDPDGCILRYSTNATNSAFVATFVTNEKCTRIDDILRTYSFSTENFTVDLLIMVACIVGFYALGFCGLWLRTRRAR